MTRDEINALAERLRISGFVVTHRALVDQMAQIDAADQERATMQRRIRDGETKRQKQAQEIARLTRLVAQLQADKADLRFDLAKAKARADQLQAVVNGGIA